MALSPVFNDVRIGVGGLGIGRYHSDCSPAEAIKRIIMVRGGSIGWLHALGCIRSQRIFAVKTTAPWRHRDKAHSCCNAQLALIG